MILSGAQVIKRGLVQNLREIGQQQQPCGIDLTLRWVSSWISPATIDFDNSRRRSANTSRLPFRTANDSIILKPGTYLVDFNETVSVPRDCMATVYPRSSLWRNGVSIHAGVVDAGYHGAMGAMLQIHNSRGILLFRDAKLAQIVFEEMGEEVEGYDGVYQNAVDSAGRSNK